MQRERSENLEASSGRGLDGCLWVVLKKASGLPGGFHLGDLKGVSGLSQLN